MSPVSRRDFLVNTGAATVSAGLSGCQTLTARKDKPVNLLWIMTDQQPVNMVSAYGRPAPDTPNIDGIAREGVRFDRCYLSAFPCSPSRATMLTGLHAHNHGVVTNDIILDG